MSREIISEEACSLKALSTTRTAAAEVRFDLRLRKTSWHDPLRTGHSAHPSSCSVFGSPHLFVSLSIMCLISSETTRSPRKSLVLAAPRASVKSRSQPYIHIKARRKSLSVIQLGSTSWPLKLLALSMCSLKKGLRAEITPRCVYNRSPSASFESFSVAKCCAGCCECSLGETLTQ